MKLKAPLVITALFGATTIGWTIADIFAAETMCKIDPTCRPLTKLEDTIAKSVFGDEFDTSKVKAVKRHKTQKALVSFLRSHIPTDDALSGTATLITPPTTKHHNPEDEASHDAAYQTLKNRMALVHQLAYAAQSQFKIPNDIESGEKFKNHSRNRQAEYAGDFYARIDYFNKYSHEYSSTKLKSNCEHLLEVSAEFAPYFKPQMPKICSLKI